MKPKYMLALVLVFVGCSFGGYWFYDFVTVEKVRLEEEQAAKEKEMASLQTQVAQLRQFADNIAKMKQEFAALNIQLQEALELMPRSFSLSALLRRMNAIAENSGLEIESFRPRKNEEKAAGQFFSTVLIDVHVKGTFTQTVLFFDQLARIKRIVNIENVKMNTQGRVVRGGGIVADTTSTLKTYRFSE